MKRILMKRIPMNSILMKRSTLGRGLPALLMLAGLFSLAALPARADDWSKTYTLTGNPDLRVDTSDANIHVSTWDQNTIEARRTTTRHKIRAAGTRLDKHH